MIDDRPCACGMLLNVVVAFTVILGEEPIMKNLSLTNTLSGTQEPFQARSNQKVSLYVCGVTPYDFAHMGHGRCYVTFDLLYRLLLFLGYDVTYCRNFTDVDDKLLSRAQQELGDRLQYPAVAQKYIDAYHEDMKALNCLIPSCEPRVTETIPEIIAFIEGLIGQDKAYVVNGDVYYRVRSFEPYGKLSKRDIDELESGARIDVDDRKEDPLDFALWKSEPEGMFWKSPWGYGRPGWHIECSAMAKKFLGDQIDIHGGGMDLMFPHHENEIAQTEGLTGKEFVKYWVHNAFVTINKEKMSKSLGNFFTLREVFKKFDPMVIRYYFLAHHYRAPLDFTFENLEAMSKSYQRLCKAFEQYDCSQKMTTEQMKTSSTVERMLGFLCDDLNASGMFGVLFEALRTLRADEACKIKAFVLTVLGLDLIPLKQEVIMTPEIERMMRERDEARATRDWNRADQLRDALQKLGVEVQDKPIKKG
ncbi:cysteine--tRNA ligase [Candidatus Babeliales bacterium]|nr:cysteine--tRNA ligase [Candidatus Babeliales bacterium]